MSARSFARLRHLIIGMACAIALGAVPSSIALSQPITAAAECTDPASDCPQPIPCYDGDSPCYPPCPEYQTTDSSNPLCDPCLFADAASGGYPDPTGCCGTLIEDPGSPCSNCIVLQECCPEDDMPIPCCLPGTDVCPPPCPDCDPCPPGYGPCVCDPIYDPPCPPSCDPPDPVYCVGPPIPAPPVSPAPDTSADLPASDPSAGTDTSGGNTSLAELTE